MNKNEQWLKWAVELQAIAQGGLFYGKDKFDIERYERIREISAEMISYKTEISIEKVQNLFCSDVGYQTPKIDTRAAIFKDGKILLVHEANGTWSLPGGWCDVDISVEENTIKEVKEESGLDVTVKRVIAVQDREKHNLPIYAYKVPQDRIPHQKLHTLIFCRIRVRHHVEPDELLRELLLPVLRDGTQAHGASRQSRNRRRYVSFPHKKHRLSLEIPKA